MEEKLAKPKSMKVNATLNVIKQCCAVVFPLITFPYVSRVLGNEGYGQYSFANSIINYFLLIAALGVSTYAIREGSKIRDDKKKITRFCRETFSINVISMVISYILLAIVLIFSAKLQSYLTLILIQSISIFLTTIGMDWINSIYEDYTYITIRYIIIQLIGLLATFIFVRSKDDVVFYTFIMAFMYSGGNILNYFYIKRYVKIKFVWKMNAKKHLPSVLIFFASTVSILIYVNADITMLGMYYSDDVVGIYSVSSKIYGILKQLLNAIVVVSIPRLSNLIQNDKEKYLQTLPKVLDSVMLFLLPGICGVFMLSEQIIYIVSGPEYISGAPSLSILAFATFFAILGAFLNSCILVVNNGEREVLVGTLIAAIANVLFNFILIPAFGINGAAITTLIAEIVACSFYIIRKRKYSEFKLRITRSIVVALVEGGVVIGVCFVCKCFISSIWICTVVSIVVNIIAYVPILLIINPLVLKENNGLIKVIFKKVLHSSK